MAKPRPLGSLEGRLVTRLVALRLLAAAIGFVGLTVKIYRMAHDLSDEGKADVFVAEFLKEAAWTFPIFVTVMIAVIVITVRSSLRPLKAISLQAATIDPAHTGVRLPTEGVPREAAPLVAAVNDALGRLDRGFEAQRRFTGDAAHELRTPLAILSAGLEALPSDPAVRQLRLEAARMERLVDQLLRVARLDALPLDTGAQLDLDTLMAEVVGQMAPWAVGQGRSVGYDGPGQPVWVHGNADALQAAVRNLIENAVHHSKAGAEVAVAVGSDGAIRVADHGPGVPKGQRQQVFERFWRAPGQPQRPGAGLGLAIVGEVARVHAGRVAISDTPGGGATFELRLPLA